MSSLWFHGTQTEASHSSDSVQEHPSNLTSIVAAAGNKLPLLAPEKLSFDKTLGKGSSFIVNRELYSRSSDTEPYYVAVKHIITGDQPPRRLQQHYDKVVRELRVLTHPSLEDNPYISKILAYGWDSGPKGGWPYLVVDYSNYGTLDEYLQRFEHSWADRRDFALDVALGLEALHESKIIHGDVKPSNVLVFEARQVIRNVMAKISDFGGAIFDLDDHRAIRYGGTSIYNAPEQEQRGKYKCETVFATEQLYQADTYSFGLTLWEIMKQGKSYIDDEWLLQGEERIDFLDRIHDEEENPLLRRAELFCNKIFWLYQESDAVLNCFRITLRDQASQRSNMTQVVGLLTHRNFAPRPSISLFPGKWYQQTAKNQPQDGLQQPWRGRKLATAAVTCLNDSNIEHPQRNIKVLDEVSEEARMGIMTLITKPNTSQLSYPALADLDLFQATLMPSPPWSVQCGLVRSWHAEAASTDSPKRFQASLQLAICYHIGYGVRPDRHLMLRYLTASLEGSGTTMVLYCRLIAAMTLDVEQPDMDMLYMTDLDRQLRRHTNRETYFAARVRLHQHLRMKKMRTTRQTVECKQHRALLLAELVTGQELNLLSDTLSSNQYSNTEISCALREASRCGNAGMVKLICAHCNEFVQDESLPTPLHWLIMFEESEVAIVAEALICGLSTEQVGPCRASINSTLTTDYGMLFIAEHCLELFGTPLHWAVRTRNLKLVELLIGLGADINARTDIPTAFITDIPRPRLPGLSPLDIAFMFHLPEIVARLLDLGANWEGGSGSLTTSHSALFCIGLNCAPFSRYIVHGKHYRDALKETIRLATERGYSINDTNAEGCDLITEALTDADCDSYIIEELLAAGALPSQRSSQTPECAVDVAISHAPFRRYSVEKLRLVLPYVFDINECSFWSINATHAAAIGGSDAMVEVLSTAQGFDVDATTAAGKDGLLGGQTALHLAAIFGSAEVISMLVQKGANMDVLDALQSTPLQIAMLHRKIEAADTLIELGANVFFFKVGKENIAGGSVLHRAVAGELSGYTLAKHLLTKHSRLQEHSILNAVDHVGWTALHKAAYFGDYEAVEVLLAQGADRTLMDTSRGLMPGRTPLEVVKHELWRLSIGAWDSDLKRIMTRGSQAKDCHVANLQEIVCMLRDDSFS